MKIIGPSILRSEITFRTQLAPQKKRYKKFTKKKAPSNGYVSEVMQQENPPVGDPHNVVKTSFATYFLSICVMTYITKALNGPTPKSVVVKVESFAIVTQKSAVLKVSLYIVLFPGLRTTVFIVIGTARRATDKLGA